MHHLQHIAELGPLFESAGVRHVIIAPGSRNAPLIQLFTGSGRFTCHSIVDERSAAYVGLGMARQSGEPVLLLTTSGTAVLNLSPAVAEAFRQRIPLLVVTADRPREILRQFNNQVTDQRAPFFNHSKGFFEFTAEVRSPEDLEKGIKSVEKLLREALQLPAGPVHLNLPLTEPLYEPLPAPLLARGEKQDPEDLSAAELPPLPGVLEGKKILVLAGMGEENKALKTILEQLVLTGRAVVVAENISNLSSEHFISNPELLLFGASEEEKATLVPDHVLAFGLQVVSKRMKRFVQSLKDAVLSELPEGKEALALLKVLAECGKTASTYTESWKTIEGRELDRAATYFGNAAFGNLTALERILNLVPEDTVVHLGNSSTIRNSQLLRTRKGLLYYANRGISGIDGSLSTAVGAAMVSEAQHLLVVGDLSFVYDSNALWNKDFPENLKIVVINDGGGGIFRLLEGPSRMEFFEEFSVTHHPVSLEQLSGAFGRSFARADSFEELDRQLDFLFVPGTGLSVLEVDCTASDNTRIFKDLFSK